MTKQRTRSDVAAAALGVDPSPSPSALAWSVAHAVAIEGGRSPDDAMAIASRWATVADMVREAPPESEWVQTGHDEFTHRSVIMAMDLNGLKRINDAEGHAAGDAVLRRAGEVLTSATAGYPYCVARIGGDEFIALMPGCDDRVAAGLQERIESMIEMNNQFYTGQRLSMAIGIASCKAAGEVEAALHEADQAMFREKTRYYDESKLERRRG